MAYSTSLPGLSEARLTAYDTLVKNSLADLNTAIARDTECTGFPALTAASVVVGDPRQITTHTIAIYAGGEDNAIDVEMAEFMSPLTDVSGYSARLYTNLDIWIHPDWVANQTSAFVQARKQEILIARITDHFRKRVWGVPANETLTLTSREYSTAPAYDTLVENRVQRVIKGVTEKQFGDGIRCYFARLVITAFIA